MSTTMLGGHDDRAVIRLLDAHEPTVRKFLPDGRGAEVYATMAALWATPFGATRTPPGLPRPLASDDAGAWIDMEHVDGAPLARRDDLTNLHRSLTGMAALLADLHRSGAELVRRRTAGKVAASCRRALGDDRPELVERLERHASAIGERLVSGHGDFGPHNVLGSSRGMVLIDFDRAQMAGAGRDVQHAAAWIAVTQWHAAGGALDWRTATSFEVAYSRRRPEAATEIGRTRPFHRSAALVRIATSWSTWRTEPWRRDALLDEASRLLGG